MRTDVVTETPEEAARRLAAGAMRDGYKLQALHCYTDSNGSPLHWRIRAKHPTTGEKWIRPMKRARDGFVLGEPVYQIGKPLYRLHHLAARPDDPVFICEGEWCADHLAELGILATTSGGADSAGRTDWNPLRGRTVTIWPDNDEAGGRYALDVNEQLINLGCTTYMVDVDALELPVKGDVVDWLERNPNATRQEIFALPRTPFPISGPAQTPSLAESTETIERAAARLAGLNPIHYERVRIEEAKRLGIRVGALDGAVKSRRNANTADSRGISFDDIEPWPESAEPGELLTGVSGLIRRFIVCDPAIADTCALWIAMTWLMDVVQIVSVR